MYNITPLYLHTRASTTLEFALLLAVQSFPSTEYPATIMSSNLFPNVWLFREAEK